MPSNLPFWAFRPARDGRHHCRRNYDRCPPGKVRLVNVNGEWYLGTYGSAKFTCNTHASAQRYFEVVAAVAAGVLVLYSGVVASVVMVRRRADRRRLTDLLQQERDYGDKLAKVA